MFYDKNGICFHESLLSNVEKQIWMLTSCKKNRMTDTSDFQLFSEKNVNLIEKFVFQIIFKTYFRKKPSRLNSINIGKKYDSTKFDLSVKFFRIRNPSLWWIELVQIFFEFSSINTSEFFETIQVRYLFSEIYCVEIRYHKFQKCFR